MPKENDLFDDDNKVTSGNWFKAEKVGDKCMGFLVSREEREDTMDTTGQTMQMVYTLVQEDGSTIKVSGKTRVERTGKKALKVLFGMDNVKLGQFCGIKFTEEKQTDAGKKKGWSPAKILSVYAKDEFKPELLEQFKNQNMEAADGSGMPF